VPIQLTGNVYDGGIAGQLIQRRTAQIDRSR
jgi:hypothetical protein